MRGFHLLVLLVIGDRVKDTQCGFKVRSSLVNLAGVHNSTAAYTVCPNALTLNEQMLINHAGNIISLQSNESFGMALSKSFDSW